MLLIKACCHPRSFFPKPIFKQRGVKNLTSSFFTFLLFCYNLNKDAFKTNIFITALLHRLPQLQPLPPQPRVNIISFFRNS